MDSDEPAVSDEPGGSERFGDGGRPKGSDGQPPPLLANESLMDEIDHEAAKDALPESQSNSSAPSSVTNFPRGGLSVFFFFKLCFPNPVRLQSNLKTKVFAYCLVDLISLSFISVSSVFFSFFVWT